MLPTNLTLLVMCQPITKLNAHAHKVNVQSTTNYFFYG